MPKQKTNKSTKKRFTVTKNGRVKRGRPGRRHLLSAKSAKRKRKMRLRPVCVAQDEVKVRKLLAL